MRSLKSRWRLVVLYMCRQSRHMLKTDPIASGRGPDKTRVGNPKYHWWSWLWWLLGVERVWSRVDLDINWERKVRQAEDTRRMLPIEEARRTRDQCEVSLYMSAMSIFFCKVGEQTWRRYPCTIVWELTPVRYLLLLRYCASIILWSWAPENWVETSQIQ